MCTVDYDMCMVVFWIDTLCSTLHIPLELDWSSLYIWVEWFPTPVRPSGSHLKQRLTARVPRCTVCTGTTILILYLPAVCIRWRLWNEQYNVLVLKFKITPLDLIRNNSQKFKEIIQHELSLLENIIQSHCILLRSWPYGRIRGKERSLLETKGWQEI